MHSALSSSSSASASSGAAMGRPRMVTRALTKSRGPVHQFDGAVGGVLRCVCSAFLLSRQETLLECHRCRNWCHPACVGVDHAALRRHQLEKSYVCPFCDGTYKRPRGAAPPPAPRQLPQRLREVPDRLPFGSVTLLRQRLRAATRAARLAGFEVIDLPVAAMTGETERQCLACCAEAIREATFSEQYPAYCLKELREVPHAYLQGTLLRSKAQQRIAALIFSNGMDVYGNLRPTLTQLKSGINRGLIDQRHQTEFMAACSKLTDVSDFVHITLSATHTEFRQRGLARMLMVIDLLKWALRGRTRAYLNMALEKKIVDDGARVEFVASPASRRLYESFGFKDVYPRFDRVTDEERWTPKEADMGRVMAHMNFVEDVIAIAKRYDENEDTHVAEEPTTKAILKRRRTLTVTTINTEAAMVDAGEAAEASEREFSSKRRRIILSGRKA